MAFDYFSLNGKILPTEQAKVELVNIEYAYGYGVYENIRVSKGLVFFLKDHSDRLLNSAKIIGIEHNFNHVFIKSSIEVLISNLQVKTCNLKIMLIGGRDKDSARLYIMCLNPLFPDRKLYKTGVHVISENYQRPFPQAKSLNMLPSYLAYKKARAAGAYDALLINKDGFITEGTRTNFFAIKNKIIYSPPEVEILLGVTRNKVIKVAKANDFEIVEKNMTLDELRNYDGLFLTSTSSKIMPIKSVDNTNFEISNELKNLMNNFSEFLNSYSS